MDWITVGGIAGLVSLGLTVLAGMRYIGRLDSLLKFHDSCPIIKVAQDVAVIKAELRLILVLMGKQAASELIAPHSPERDKLLRKLMHDEISDSEAESLLVDIESNLDEFVEKKSIMAVWLITFLRTRLNGGIGC